MTSKQTGDFKFPSAECDITLYKNYKVIILDKLQISAKRVKKRLKSPPSYDVEAMSGSSVYLNSSYEPTSCRALNLSVVYS